MDISEDLKVLILLMVFKFRSVKIIFGLVFDVKLFFL
jgi:hypothetical protein